MTIDKFMNENNMHPSIKSRIMAFYELQWQYNSVCIVKQLADAQDLSILGTYTYFIRMLTTLLLQQIF